ncbi:MAG TPA: hypothetical protein VF557_16425 [Jatrophihabitans sp.]|jgi:hypothetical protein|uniref:hypothetical protein n=1 Tax=Jatrophihabitans sp. TaxID=1932789 RepID=UPI002F236DE7
MTSECATLRLEPAVATGAFLDGNIMRQPESHFLDLVVDGQSMRTLAAEQAQDYVTELNRPWLHEVANTVDRFLGRRADEFPAPGRVALLVCPHDGDLGCGQLTAALTFGAAEVTWSDFRWEDDRFDPRPEEHLDQALTFSRAQYESAFADAYRRLAAFSYDELAHRGRRFLWPWQWGWRLPPRV